MGAGRGNWKLQCSNPSSVLPVITPSLGAFPKSPHSHKRHLYRSCHLGHFKGLGSSGPGMRQDQIRLLIHHNIKGYYFMSHSLQTPAPQAWSLEDTGGTHRKLTGLCSKTYPSPGTTMRLQNPAAYTQSLGSFGLIVFGLVHSKWKFQGQGANLHHSSDQSHSSDNAGSLTHGATRELLKLMLLFLKN